MPNNNARNVHCFYYPWHGNPATDGAWSHWNHVITDGSGRHYEPPEQIGADFYPEAGLYSDNNADDLNLHMNQLADAGVGVAVLSWWGAGHYTDKAVRGVMDAAHGWGVECAFHLEPIRNGGAAAYREAMEYILTNYGDHPAFHRGSNGRPVYYLYDSYLIPPSDWNTILKNDGANTIRRTELDADIIGLIVHKKEFADLAAAGFDGIYSYFASDGFRYGCSPKNWPEIDAWAKSVSLKFIPSVAPGYIDERIRPWNAQNTRDRENGAYYDRMWRAAIGINPEIVSITSFNEWHEGSQIEPAVPKKTESFTYEDYEPRAPDYYLKRTRFWAKAFSKKKE